MASQAEKLPAGMSWPLFTSGASRSVLLAIGVVGMQSLRTAVVRPQRSFRRVGPGSRVLHLRIDGIVQAILGGVFAHDEELDGRMRVVEKRMRDSGSRRERNRVTFVELAELAIDPQARPALNDEYELLVIAVSMRKRGATAREDRLVIDAEVRQTECLSERRGDIAARAFSVLSFETRKRPNEGQIVTRGVR